jgi:glucose/mannose-6-phosphate isomerase
MLKSLLNDQELLREKDKAGMLDILSAFNKQLLDSINIATQFDYIPEGEIRQIVIPALGGSATGASIAKVFLRGQLEIPFIISRQYKLPVFVDSKTLALPCSYSGNTDETLEAFEFCCARNIRVICITSGGELGKRATARGLPIIKLPKGLPPRAAYTYSFCAIVRILEKIGVVSNRMEEVRNSVNGVEAVLSKFTPDIPTEENRAKKLAIKVLGSIPVVYGSTDSLSPIARRWANQFCENGKHLAFWNFLPEMAHNEIEGWKNPPGCLQQMLPLFLRDQSDLEKVNDKINDTRNYLLSRDFRVLEYWSSRETWLEKLWELLLLGDFASTYLSFLNGEDPSEIKAIKFLKEKKQIKA